MGCNGLGCLNLRVITFHCSYPNPSKREGRRSKKISREGSLRPSLMLFQARQGLILGMRNMRPQQHGEHRSLNSVTTGVTSHPSAQSWTMRLAVGIPLCPWCCSHTLAWGALKSRELLFTWGHLGGVDFLGVSGQERDEGCDLSVSSATPFWSPVNFQSISPASLGLGWAWVLVEGPTQLTLGKKEARGKLLS